MYTGRENSEFHAGFARSEKEINTISMKLSPSLVWFCFVATKSAWPIHCTHVALLNNGVNDNKPTFFLRLLNASICIDEGTARTVPPKMHS